jgi:hypothetical protein
MKKPSRLAYHEAAHAVAAHAVGGVLGELALLDKANALDPDALGVVDAILPDPIYPGTGRQADQGALFAWLIFATAGAAGEVLYEEGSRVTYTRLQRSVFKGDMQTARLQLRRVGVNTEKWRNIIEKAAQLAFAMLHCRRDLVAALAVELDARGSIPADEAVAFLEARGLACGAHPVGVQWLRQGGRAVH